MLGFETMDESFYLLSDLLVYPLNLSLRMLTTPLDKIHISNFIYLFKGSTYERTSRLQVSAKAKTETNESQWKWFKKGRS